MAVDLLDLRYGEAACVRSPAVRVSDDWAVFSPLRMCSPSRLVREITTFVRGDDDCWRRDDEQHVNVLMDTARIPRLLDPLGIDFTVGSSFGAESSTEGLVTIVGTRHP